MRMYEWIRTKIESTRGLTQAGLSERLGLDPSAVNRMLHGNRNIMAWEVPIIEDYIGARFAPEIFAEDARNRLEQKGSPALRGFGEGGAPAIRLSPSLEPAIFGGDVVPVYGHATGALETGLNLAQDTIADWAPRHPLQRGIQGAFAIYAFSDAMAPRYFPGELIYVHPGRPPQTGRDCVIEMKNGEALLYRYLGQSEKTLQAEQLNPPREIRIPKSKIKAFYAVIGRG